MNVTVTTITPPPKFADYQVVRVPAGVHESQQAQVIGREPGPYARKHSPTWTYFIRFAAEGMPWNSAGEWWQATEEELIAWQHNNQ